MRKDLYHLAQNVACGGGHLIYLALEFVRGVPFYLDPQFIAMYLTFAF